MTSTSEVLSLVEFGKLVVSGECAQFLTGSSVIERLRQSQVIDVQLGGAGKIVIVGKAYVGHALLGNGKELRIAEKHDGAVRNLLPWASPSNFVGVDVPSAAQDSMTLFAELCRRFLGSVARYLQRDLVKNYKYELRDLYSPRGRIDWRQQARSNARGRFGRVACLPPRLSSDNLANGLLGMVLNVIDSFSASGELSLELVAKARALAAYFDSPVMAQISRSSWHAKSEHFRSELAKPGIPATLRESISYGRPIALHALGTHSRDAQIDLPCSFFLNVATLFEDAVVNCLGHCASWDLVRRVTDMEPHYVFDRTRGHYRVTPDFFLRTIDGDLVVGDCKYKLQSGFPGHADVYQILTHADACGAKKALLVYPGDSTRLMDLGFSKGGVRCYSVTVDPTDLEVSIRTVLDEFDFLGA